MKDERVERGRGGQTIELKTLGTLENLNHGEAKTSSFKLHWREVSLWADVHPDPHKHDVCRKPPVGEGNTRRSFD
jgi:hypothetical protein